jgi:1,4-alpha-glucan branching enzyme
VWAPLRNKVALRIFSPDERLIPMERIAGDTGIYRMWMPTQETVIITVG